MTFHRAICAVALMVAGAALPAHAEDVATTRNVFFVGGHHAADGLVRKAVP